MRIKTTLRAGAMAGNSASPTHLDVVAEVLFWSGCAAFLASGVYLGMTLYPRDIRGVRGEATAVLPACHRVAVGARLWPRHYASVEEDSEHRLVEQLLSVSRLVHKKYASTRKALLALGLGTALCLAAVSPERRHHARIAINFRR